MIPYGRQSIDDSDVQAVVETLKSAFLTQGPAVERFEEDLARVCGAKYAVAMNSGTAALHLAALAFDCDRDTELFTSAITFAASSNCGLYAGARTTFVDVDRETINLDLSQLESRLKKSRAKRKLIVAVHYAGLPCDLDELSALAARYDARVIEDAAHALGATYKGKPIGGIFDQNLVTLSFHPVKAITTGEGGAVLTNNQELRQRLRAMRTHGIVKEGWQFPEENEGPWYQEMQTIGFNYRMPDVLAALGSSQLKRLSKFIQVRKKIAGRYHQELLGLPGLELPREHAQLESAWHLYAVQIEFDRLGVSKKEALLTLREQGIGTQVHYIPVYRHPVYRRLLGDVRREYPNAERFYARAVSLPIFPDLTESDQGRVIHGVRSLLRSGT